MAFFRERDVKCFCGFPANVAMNPAFRNLFWVSPSLSGTESAIGELEVGVASWNVEVSMAELQRDERSEVRGTN